MNDDLISRQAGIDAILAVTGNSSVRELYEHVQEHGLSDMWSGGVNAAIDIIIAVPSAQPERKKGKWVEVAVTDGYDKDGIKTWISVMQCDQCGFIVNAVEGHMAQYNYCPNCGAQMMGGES